VEIVGPVGQEDSLHKGTDHHEESLVQGADTSQVVRHMACPDSLGQEQDHLVPTDLAVLGRSVGDMVNVEETDEGPEDLKGLAGLAVVD
jgi:hypothetical protein